MSTKIRTSKLDMPYAVRALRWNAKSGLMA